MPVKTYGANRYALVPYLMKRKNEVVKNLGQFLVGASTTRKIKW